MQDKSKECIRVEKQRAACRNYYKKNKDYLNSKTIARRKNNSDSKEYQKKYVEKNRDRVNRYAREYYKKYYIKNKEKILDRCKKNNIKYQLTDKAKESNKRKCKKYRELNKDKVNRAKNLWKANKVSTDINYKIRDLLRGRLRHAIKNKQKNGSAVKLLGCSIPEFIKYFETLFHPGMSWDNQGDWHIDHKIPLVSFDLQDPEQLAKACHYTNLQPLWALDNISKGCRII